MRSWDAPSHSSSTCLDNAILEPGSPSPSLRIANQAQCCCLAFRRPSLLPAQTRPGRLEVKGPASRPELGRGTGVESPPQLGSPQAQMDPSWRTAAKALDVLYKATAPPSLRHKSHKPSTACLARTGPKTGDRYQKVRNCVLVWACVPA